ncbi:MAG TPA: thioredoxin domain-containing protein [Rhodopila sp.]|jgi:protein-disulfide isomerase
MRFSRRSFLTVLPTGLIAGAVALRAGPARADDPDPRAERYIGKPDAKVTVGEYFSLTCTHCAAFAASTFPEIKKNLIETGAVRWVFHDFPLDQVALTASMVARYLPIDRYEPFVNALFASQNRWAFNRGNDPTEELWKLAGLAGMSRTTFDKAIGDKSLREWIIQQQKADADEWKIDSTPSFVINNQKYAGEMSYEAFRKLIPA